ncbi:MAG: hypothetical protein AB1779_05235 [Candidatus Thermoplasmatota archaeon]
MPKKITKKAIERVISLRDNELMSFEDIGRKLGISRDTASKYYRQYKQEIDIEEERMKNNGKVQENSEDKEKVIAMTDERIPNNEDEPVTEENLFRSILKDAGLRTNIENIIISVFAGNCMNLMRIYTILRRFGLKHHTRVAIILAWAAHNDLEIPKKLSKLINGQEAEEVEGRTEKNKEEKLTSLERKKRLLEELEKHELIEAEREKLREERLAAIAKREELEKKLWLNSLY